MWLIDTTSLELEYVIDPKDGKHTYAILSHTWGEEELSFQEWRSGVGREKAGYEKVARTCKQACRDRYDYAWVDTVCINKESSAELSEAINSMWQWYANAAVCYAYLSDVPAECPILEDRSSIDRFLEIDSDDEGMDDANEDLEDANQPWIRLFGRSRWFTRGWTLQELLAPREIYFFSKDWELVGRRDRLIHTLSDITGIDEFALSGTDHRDSVAIARKMSWAADRQTSRIEDRAYSLLGLFGINLPLLYGEGERAFIRLQEELVRTSTDHSILVWADNEYLNNLYHALESGRNFDLLFAKSPDHFRKGRTMVLWDAAWKHSPFQLTNSGLHFDSIPVTKLDDRYCAILNCRFEDDLQGPVALLLRKDSPSKNEFYVNDRSEYIDGRPSFPRCVVRPNSEGAELLEQKITIRRFFTIPSDTLFRPSRRILPKIWIKRGSSSPKFDIITTYPERGWNRETGVFIPTEDTHVESIAASLTLRFRSVKATSSESDQQPLSIAFDLGYDREYSRATVCEPIRIVISKEQNLKKLLRGLVEELYDLPIREAELESEDGRRISASLKESTIFDDPVCIINVGYEPTTPTASGSAGLLAAVSEPTLGT